VLMRDVLDHLHAMSRLKAAGDQADLGEAAETQARLQALADDQTLASLARLWKVALGGLEDVRVAPDPVSAAEMAMIRLMAAADLPSPEEAARLLAGQGPAGAAPSAGPDGAASGAPTHSERAPGPQAQTIAQPAPALSEPPPPADARLASIDDLAEMIDAAREIRLLVDVQRYVRLVAIDAGKLVFEPADGAPQDLSTRLAQFLKDQTGDRWLVDGRSQSRGQETLEERRLREREENLEAARRDPAIQKALDVFPDAALVSIIEPPAHTHETQSAPPRAPAQETEDERSRRPDEAGPGNAKENGRSSGAPG